MNKIALLILALAFVSCKQSAKGKMEGALDAKETVQAPGAFDWLHGDWKRLNEEAGKSTFEVWQKVNDTAYSGFGFTLRDTDTIWQEHMNLLKHGGSWRLEIQSPQDPEPTVFNLTAMEDHSFTFENPEIDFPKRIAYARNEKEIHATVSGEEMEIVFQFQRLPE